MEILEEEKEKKSGWTRLLLIINLIIWTLIIIMACIFKGVVKAATLQQANGYQLHYNNSDTWSSLQTNGSRINMALPVDQINVDYGNLQGSLTGNIYYSIENIHLDTNYVINVQIWNANGQNNNASASKSCTSRLRNNGNYDVECQIQWNAVAYTQQYYTISIMPNQLNGILSYITLTASVEVEQQTPASSTDIQTQTTSIINSIVTNIQESIQNAIQNNNSIENKIETATNSIQNALINSMVNLNYTCKDYSANDITLEKWYFDANGNLVNGGSDSPWGVTDYINIKDGSIKVLQEYTNATSTTGVFYDASKSKISTFPTTSQSTITIPQNATYVRFTINKNNGRPVYEVCIPNTNALIQELYNEHMEQIAQLDASFNAITVDDTALEDLEDMEDDLHTYTNVDLNAITVNLDPDTGSWVWNTLTSLINTNIMVYGMIISILSLGVIKMILNR